jgi:hypothetical protein
VGNKLRGANKVPQRVLQPLTLKHNSSAESGYYNILCADGNFRHCKQALAAWVADCPEYSDLNDLEQHVCFWWKCLKNELGNYVHLHKQYPRRNHNLYRTLGDAHSKGVDAELLLCYVHQIFNLFRPFPSIVRDLPKPDLLHTM